MMNTWRAFDRMAARETFNDVFLTGVVVGAVSGFISGLLLIVGAIWWGLR